MEAIKQTFGETSFLNILGKSPWDKTFFYFKENPFVVLSVDGNLLVGEREDSIVRMAAKFGISTEGYSIAVYDKEQDEFFIKP